MQRRHAASARRILCQPFDLQKQSTIARRRGLCKTNPPLIGDTGRKTVDPDTGKEAQVWGLISRGAKPVGLSKTERRDEVLKVAGQLSRGSATMEALCEAIVVYGDGLVCSGDDA
jgi:diadenosine tetraphosphatase ApaH/serine/threonine PP2A family protein phosphatase